MNKSYELMSIYNIRLGEEEALELSEELKELIRSLGGDIVSENFWGERKFAYKIGTQEKGFYDVILFDLEGSQIDGLKKQINLKEDVVRYLISTAQE